MPSLDVVNTRCQCWPAQARSMEFFNYFRCSFGMAFATRARLLLYSEATGVAIKKLLCWLALSGVMATLRS